MNESPDASKKKAVDNLMKDCALSVVGAMRVSGLSRTTVSKILKGADVKPATIQQFLRSLDYYKHSIAPATQEAKASDATIALKKDPGKSNQLALEYQATLMRQKADETSGFLRELSNKLDPERPPKRTSEVDHFIRSAERISNEYAILKRLLQL